MAQLFLRTTRKTQTTEKVVFVDCGLWIVDCGLWIEASGHVSIVLAGAVLLYGHLNELAHPKCQYKKFQPIKATVPVCGFMVWGFMSNGAWD